MIFKYVSYSMQEIQGILLPSIEWLKENIGEQITKVIILQTIDPEETQADWRMLVDSYQQYTGRTDEPLRVIWYKGADWNIFKTISYEQIEHSQYMRNVYGLFMVVNDDIQALQLKLAVL